MNDPINIKTKKVLSPIIEDGFDKALVLNYIEKNIYNYMDVWVRFQQEWANRAYNTFKDYDKYLLLIYLFRQIWQGFSDKFIYYSLDEFYSQDKFEIDKLNLIKISEELHIPKETIRRKVNEFQKEGILTRAGKTIIVNKAAFAHQKPLKTIETMSLFIQKNSTDLQGEKWFGTAFNKDEIKLFINKYFTICWLRFFKLQIPFLVGHRDVFTDLETWNVWGVIAINHNYSLKKNLDNNVFKKENINQNYYRQVIASKVPHGINASSISDISLIPRATVIRKLKWLMEKKLINKNKEFEYTLKNEGKLNKKINENVYTNMSLVAEYLTNIFDLMKNSKFKIN